MLNGSRFCKTSSSLHEQALLDIHCVLVVDQRLTMCHSNENESLFRTYIVFFIRIFSYMGMRIFHAPSNSS